MTDPVPTPIASRECSYFWLTLRQFTKHASSVMPNEELRTMAKPTHLKLLQRGVDVCEAAVVFKPETLVRWHRAASVCTGVASRAVVSAGLRSRPTSAI